MSSSPEESETAQTPQTPQTPQPATGNRGPSGAQAIAAAVLLGDQPEVTSAIIDAVVAAFRSSGSPCARPLYSAAGKAIPGHPVVLARSLWPAIRALRGDRGAGPLLAEHPEWVCEVRVEGTPPIDVDRAEDYDAVRSRLG